MKSVLTYRITRKLKVGETYELNDEIIAEEPLEIFIKSTLNKVNLSEPFITVMRTPGNDLELCYGLLYNLEIIEKKENVIHVKYLISNSEATQILISINVPLEDKSYRSFSNSSCGFCNAKSFDDVSKYSSFPVYNSTFRLDKENVFNAVQKVDKTDDLFSKTGGNHKVSLFNANGDIINAFEDVGRHNALDKLVGKSILNERLPLEDCFIVLSGRCSYEMCQKAWMAGIPVIVAIGAPTTMSIELAENAGITLLGFVKKESFNIYTHDYRISELINDGKG